MGKAYVDNAETPSAYKIQLGRFSILRRRFWEGGQAMLKDIKPYNLFMSSSAGWAEEGREIIRRTPCCF
jgi:hypothetical protein